MTGRVVQINVSLGGLPKRPVAEGRLTPLGIEGDVQAHPRFHGGPLKAVLLICSEVIEELSSRGYALYGGAMGENITTAGIDRTLMRPLQRYRIGEAMIELTTIRVPCSSLDVYGPSLKRDIYDRAVKAGDVKSPRWAMSGFYGSVVRAGMIRTGDIIALVDQAV